MYHPHLIEKNKHIFTQLAQRLRLPETTTNNFFNFSPLSFVSIRPDVDSPMRLSSSLFNGTNGIVNDDVPGKNFCLFFWLKNFLIMHSINCHRNFQFRRLLIDQTDERMISCGWLSEKGFMHSF